MTPSLRDTIVALSSAAPADSCAGLARAILRLSGPRARALAGSVFSPNPARTAGKAKSWRRVQGRLAWRERTLPACAYVMPGPRSYTRQDVVELHVPALRVCLSETLETLLRQGARAALPGEFTRRALLNGRLSLAQAEAVGALIRAHSADEARVMAERSTGEGTAQRKALRVELEELLALIELGLDFSQEEAEGPDREALRGRIQALARRARAWSARKEASGGGLLSSAHPRVVLVGPPNSGKSSLFNALLGRAGALVSEEAHTTRDPVEATLEAAPGQPVQLVDCAGLAGARKGAAALESALHASARKVRGGDILLFVLDRSRPLDLQAHLAALRAVLSGRAPPCLTLVWTKADLPEAAAWREEMREAPLHIAQALSLAPPPACVVSALSGEGLSGLRAFLAEQAVALRSRVAAARAAGEAMAREGTAQALDALERAARALGEGLAEDAAAVELREALHALSRADQVLLRHDALTESLLDRIFSDFCIGK